MMVIRPEEIGPQQVIDVINSIELEQDRLGYIVQSKKLINMIKSMIGAWEKLLAGMDIKNSTEEELKEGMLLLKEITLQFIDGTDKLYNCMNEDRKVEVEQNPNFYKNNKAPEGMIV